MKRLLVLITLFAHSVVPATAQSRSDLTDELDLLAIALFDEIQPLSIRDNVEYCGLLGYDAAGVLTATEAQRGDVDSCDPGIEPEGFEVIASYHTHGAYSPDADSEVPSVDDLLGDFEEDIDGYVATPGGRVWLNLVEEELSVQLCGRGCVHADANYRACPVFSPAAEYTVAALVAREERDIGVC